MMGWGNSRICPLIIPTIVVVIKHSMPRLAQVSAVLSGAKSVPRCIIGTSIQQVFRPQYVWRINSSWQSFGREDIVLRIYSVSIPDTQCSYSQDRLQTFDR